MDLIDGTNSRPIAHPPSPVNSHLHGQTYISPPERLNASRRRTQRRNSVPLYWSTGGVSSLCASSYGLVQPLCAGATIVNLLTCSHDMILFSCFLKYYYSFLKYYYRFNGDAVKQFFRYKNIAFYYLL